MNQVIQEKFIPQQLLYFLAGRRCCQQFACTYRPSEHEAFVTHSRAYGLRSQIVYNNGQNYIKVFKQACRHYMEQPKNLSLSSVSIMNMFTMLSRTALLGREDHLELSDLGSQTKPTWRSIQLPLPVIRPQTAYFKTEGQRFFLQSFPGHQHYDEILKVIYSNRVIVFDADRSWDKSVFLPLLILDDCGNKKSSVRIMCIEKDGVVALHNSQRMAANYFGEEVGESVGIQLPNALKVGYKTHIVFSTAQYFLRAIATLKFDNISHVVVNDVHLHDPYTDILLSELRDVLNRKPNLRVILLSQTENLKKFTAFFGEGAEVNMKRHQPSRTRIAHLDDIHSSIALAGIHKGPDIYKEIPEIFRTKSQRNEQIDTCLQAYEDLGTDAAIRPFLYAINYDLVPVNYRHSVNGKTAALIASDLNNAHHLRMLLFMGADPYIVDMQQQNAISLAASKGNHECIDVLNNYSLHGYVVKNAKPEFVDYDLIIDIMYLLRTKPEFTPGNILIILPTYYHIVKLNYMLLSHCLTGNLQELSIFLLHESIKMEYIESLIKTRCPDTVKVVLTTDIIESLPLQEVPFKYLIDTACRLNTVYDSSVYGVDDRYEWVSKDCLMRRELILDIKAPDAQCFRLISKEAFNALPETSEPRLQTMQLDKICLAVKMLSPNMMISEYLAFTISPPPLINVHHAVQFLKKIDVLDEMEEVTWLGCRLQDIPLPCQLGRLLIFGILLQCLDPILTIVSSLTTADPLGIPFNEDIDHLWDRFTIYIQNRIKNERSRLADNQFSDHFIFLRLFHEWQSRLRNKMPPLYLTDEYDFVLNGLMEQMNYTRSEIVSALRSANLIHGNGQLSMTNLNQMSGNWHIVKAALTGGMYPNICAVDQGNKCLKSAISPSVHLHPNTVLRDFLEPLKISAMNFRTPWIVCTRHKDHIVYATMVVPLAVALFSGPTRLRLSQVCDSQSNDRNAHLFIDEWIWMIMPKPVVEMVMKTRQYFFKMYHELLKNCCNQELWRRESGLPGSHHAALADAISKIFESEESYIGFSKPPAINYRPLATPATPVYLLTVNAHFSWIREIDENRALSKNQDHFYTHMVERQFFMLYTEEDSEGFYSNTSSCFIESVLGKFVRPIETPIRHIFVILYRKNPDVMISVSRAKTINGEFTLKEYFRNSIPVYEILDACISLKVNVPVFDGRLMSCLIDKRVGNLIMDLFAFRHHWIHKR